MTAYIVGHVSNVQVGDKIKEYLRRIDATLSPFGARWIIHDSQPEVVEGNWDGALVVIEFPDLDQAHQWYHSKAYQEILHLRTDVSDGTAVVASGVAQGYLGANKVAEIEGREIRTA